MLCECQDQNVPEFTLDEVSEHCGFHSCWIVYVDKVYDITEFMQDHPGGFEILLENAGSDATSVFKDAGHSKDARAMLSQYFIGNLVQEEKLYKKASRRGKKCRICLSSKLKEEAKKQV